MTMMSWTLRQHVRISYKFEMKGKEPFQES